jgi:hypothetical protein
LKELGRSYLTMTKDATRVMNRIKALYRSWAKCVVAFTTRSIGSTEKILQLYVGRLGPKRPQAANHITQQSKR